MRTPAPTWVSVRTAYAKGEGSLNELADRFGLGRKAVQSRCLREGWARQKVDAVKAVEKAVEGAVKERAGTIAEHAGRFMERAVAEGHGWLDQIERAKTLLADGDVDGLCKLVRHWVLPVDAMRKILRPEETATPKVQIGLYSGCGSAVLVRDASDLPGEDP